MLTTALGLYTYVTVWNIVYVTHVCTLRSILATKVFILYKLVRYNVVPYNSNITKLVVIYAIANEIHWDKSGKLQISY